MEFVRSITATLEVDTNKRTMRFDIEADNFADALAQFSDAIARCQDD